MAFQLPLLSLTQAIVDAAGKPTTVLQRWWQTMAKAIEAQENNQDTNISQIQAALALAGTGVVSTDATSGTAKSGQATTTGLTVDASTFVNGPLVALAGITAPMTHLTLTGSGPQSALSSAGPMDGEYRIVEIVGVTETTIYTGTFTVKTLGTGATVINLANPVNTTIFTRAASGSVSYRLDVRKTAGAGVANALQAYLFARRAP